MNRTRAAWIDVELENIVHNVKAVQALAQKDAGRPVMAMPVIKGNAYGHGIFEVARILGESGVEWMAVATYSEARLARLAAPQAKVLILGYTPLDMMGEIVRYGIRPCVYTYEQALTLSQQAQAQGKTAYIHIKVDTGMHRLGFNVSEQSADTVAAICDLPNVCVEGLFTHFATSAMREKEYVHYQYRGFAAFKEMLAARGVDIPVKHLSNCGIILDSPEYHQDMIRFGSMVFGSYSSNEVCKARVRPGLYRPAPHPHCGAAPGLRRYDLSAAAEEQGLCAAPRQARSHGGLRVHGSADDRRDGDRERRHGRRGHADWPGRRRGPHAPRGGRPCGNGRL